VAFQDRGLGAGAGVPDADGAIVADGGETAGLGVVVDPMECPQRGLGRLRSLAEGAKVFGQVLGQVESVWVIVAPDPTAAFESVLIQRLRSAVVA
jgi:hypothetical protein